MVSVRLTLVTPGLVLCLNEWKYQYSVTSREACTRFSPVLETRNPPFDKSAEVRYRGMDAVAAAEAVDLALDRGEGDFVLSPRVLAEARLAVVKRVNAAVLGLVDRGEHAEHVARHNTVYFYEGVFREYALECPYLMGRTSLSEDERLLALEGRRSLTDGPRPLGPAR